MKYSDITSRIIKCALKVHSTLGPGFAENVYENSLILEFQKEGLSYERQLPIDVFYDDRVVGEFRLDIMVEEKVIVELKALSMLLNVHRAQVINYLKATKREVALLLNFGACSLEIERKEPIFSKKNN